MSNTRAKTVSPAKAEAIREGKVKAFRVVGEVYQRGHRYLNLVHIKSGRPRTVRVVEADKD